MNVRRDSIPVELRKRTQWVLWKRERRRAKDGQWKWTKVPYQPECPRVRAKVDDPATWGTFEQAIDAVEG